MMEKALLILVSVLTTSLFAESFYWKPSADEWANFGDAANWSTEAVDGAAAGRIPGAKDDLTETQSFCFDLGGKTYELRRWDMSTWNHRDLSVRNGTLCFTGGCNLHGGTLYVAPDATLKFAPGATFYPGVNDAAVRVVRVDGVFDLTDANFPLYHVDFRVAPGGKLLASAKKFSVEGAQGDSVIRNEGFASFGGGYVLKGNNWGGTVQLENAAKAELVLGGDVSENGWKAHIKVILEGGVVHFTSNCLFDVSSAQFADNAEVQLDVAEGMTADLSVFSAGKNVKILKTGKGTLVLDKIDAAVMAEEGTLALMKPEDGGKTGVPGDRPLNFALAGSADFKWLESPRPELSPLCRVFASAPVSFGEPLEFTLEGTSPVSASDRRKGEVAFWLMAPGCRSSWRIPAKEGACFLLVGGEKYPLLNTEKNGGLGPVRSGNCLKLRFPLPANEAGEWKIRFENGIAGSGRKVGFYVAKGIPKIEIPVEVDRANRNFYIDVSCFGDEAKCFRWWFMNHDAVSPFRSDVPSKTVVSTNHLFRHRMPDSKEPFSVRLSVESWASAVPALFETNLVIRPVDSPLRKPFPNENVLVGICAYGDPTRLVSEMITNELCNLFVQWVGGDRLSMNDRLDPAVAAKGHGDKMYSMTIYGNYGEEIVTPLRREYGDRYLGNNIGEYAGYLYQGPKETFVPQNHDVIEAKEYFVNEFIHRKPGRGGQAYPFVFSTSGSPLATYELQGGIDYICNELYAVGSANLAYASSEARGASRRWKPEFWCSWLAEEWQTFPVPYKTAQKYDLLLAGYLQQYVMGTSMIVLESGTQSAQAWQYTDFAPGSTNRMTQGYDDYGPVHYRKITKDFYDFVKANPRDKGTPDTSIAFALGNGDAFVGMSVDWFAAWGQHAQAATNGNWRYGLPEFTWLRVQDTFFPRRPDNLKPFPNYWLAGSPYGQVDVISVDDESHYSDLCRYKLLSFVGWNTMTPTAQQVLNSYVTGGGTLVIGTPHFSARRDREYREYTTADILQPFFGIKIGNRCEVEGELVVSDAAPAALKTLVTGFKGRKLRLAELGDLGDAEVLASFGDRPLLVKKTVGNGTVYFLSCWDFPGNEGPVSDLYAGLLVSLASQVPQRVTIEAAGGHDDCGYICYAAYDTSAYFLNLDCVSPRTVKVKFADGSSKILTLAPHELITEKIQRRD